MIIMAAPVRGKENEGQERQSAIMAYVAGKSAGNSISALAAP
jgi:hypothetical protein